MQKLTKELVQGIIGWEVKTWSKALYYWDRRVDWSKVKNCLELGAREGGLSLWLALKDKKVTCSDVGKTKILAQKLHLKYDIAESITYCDINAAAIPYENYFDIVIFKSILGGIGSNKNPQLQQQVIDEVYKALKPGGKLLFAENAVATALHNYFRKKYSAWYKYWHYTSIDDMKNMLQHFSAYNLKCTGFLGAFGKNEKQRNCLATADNLLFNRICPDKWKYVIYGIAEK